MRSGPAYIKKMSFHQKPVREGVLLLSKFVCMNHMVIPAPSWREHNCLVNPNGEACSNEYLDRALLISISVKTNVSWSQNPNDVSMIHSVT